jgi:hypothetical protein
MKDLIKSNLSPIVFHNLAVPLVAIVKQLYLNPVNLKVVVLYTRPIMS